MPKFSRESEIGNPTFLAVTKHSSCREKRNVRLGEFDAMEIEWTDSDPETGAKRYICAEKFARQWRFKVRFKRRTEWNRNVAVTRDMWETLLDGMERRYRRREGISDEDLIAVRQILSAIKPDNEPKIKVPKED